MKKLDRPHGRWWIWDVGIEYEYEQGRFTRYVLADIRTGERYGRVHLKPCNMNGHILSEINLPGSMEMDSCEDTALRKFSVWVEYQQQPQYSRHNEQRVIIGQLGTDSRFNHLFEVSTGPREHSNTRRLVELGWSRSAFVINKDDPSDVSWRLEQIKNSAITCRPSFLCVSVEDMGNDFTNAFPLESMPDLRVIAWHDELPMLGGKHPRNPHPVNVIVGKMMMHGFRQIYKEGFSMVFAKDRL